MINEFNEVVTVLSPYLSSFMHGTLGAVVAGIIHRTTPISELKKLKTKELSEALVQLRNNGNISWVDFYKTNNFLKIAKMADRYFSKKNGRTASDRIESEVNNDFNYDWYMRFYEGAGFISDEKLQSLWAKVLAGEIQDPGKFSLRALDTLRNMSQKEASLFQKLLPFVIYSYYTKFIFDFGFRAELDYIGNKNPIKKAS